MAGIKMSKREANLAIATLGFLVFYIFYQFFLSPKWEEIRGIQRKLSTLQMSLDLAEGKLKILESMENKMGAIPARRQPALAGEEKALEVLRYLAWATSKSKLNLRAIKPLPPGPDGLRFELSCFGYYQQFYEFLEVLHGLEVLILIDSLDINGGGEQSPTLNIRILLTAYN
jgi:Tfp pilus assembly protein PilO